MAFLVLITSVNLTIDMHFCRGHLHSYSLLGKAKNCSQTSKASLMKQCPHYRKMMAQKSGCVLNEKKHCQNSSLHFQVKQDKNGQELNPEINIQVQHFIVAYALMFIPKIIWNMEELPSFVHYKPPIADKNILVLIQSFLL